MWLPSRIRIRPARYAIKLSQRYAVLAIFEDAEENVWAAHRGGLLR